MALASLTLTSITSSKWPMHIVQGCFQIHHPKGWLCCLGFWWKVWKGGRGGVSTETETADYLENEFDRKGKIQMNIIISFLFLSYLKICLRWQREIDVVSVDIQAIKLQFWSTCLYLEFLMLGRFPLFLVLIRQEYWTAMAWSPENTHHRLWLRLNYVLEEGFMLLHSTGLMDFVSRDIPRCSVCSSASFSTQTSEIESL